MALYLACVNIGNNWHCEYCVALYLACVNIGNNWHCD